MVEDNGDRVVGWSTLGTSAIITVVMGWRPGGWDALSASLPQMLSGGA